MAPAVGRSAYIDRCRKASLVGLSPETELPALSTLDSVAGSSRPRQELVGVINQPSLDPRADVAGAAEREAAIEQRLAEVADLLAQLGFAHGCTRNALVKKSGVPKLPLLQRQRQRRLADAEGPRHAGIDLRADVQTRARRARPPPRPTSRRPPPPGAARPASTKPCAMRPSVCSTSAPASFAAELALHRRSLARARRSNRSTTAFPRAACWPTPAPRAPGPCPQRSPADRARTHRGSCFISATCPCVATEQLPASTAVGPVTLGNASLLPAFAASRCARNSPAAPSPCRIRR